MQANCPNCSNRLVIDDAKVPATPFMLKCPKCQGTMKLPGKAAASESPPAPSPSPSPPPAAPRPASAAASSGVPAPAQPPDPPAVPPPSQAAPGSAGRALLSFPSSGQASAVSAVLGRLGYAVETLDQADEKLLRLQQGDFDFVATSRNGVPEDRSIYPRLQTLPPEVRRRLFLLVVGDEFQSGEGTQAFAALADLVLHPKDVPTSDGLVSRTLMERRRLFQTFLDAEDRKTEGKL